MVHLQPVVDLRNGSVHLFEALARHELSDGRLAHPGEFLPHLTTDDQRVLFVSVLDQGLRIIASWDRSGVHHDLSVNLPPEILLDHGLPHRVAELLRTHGVRPERLGLELLESQSMGLESQRVALQELTALGVGLAMDDLGSGYSSLQRLASFPFNALKLDRGLFAGVHDKPLETLSVMASLIQLGRDLAMDVVIEGLEDRHLTEAAVILGAPLGQGYFFAEPLAADQCLPWASSFDYSPDRSSIRTALGALAYHWQFSRLAAPHPRHIGQCPLTHFLEREGAGSDVDGWHARQHTSHGPCETSSRLLIRWLAGHVVPSE